MSSLGLRTFAAGSAPSDSTAASARPPRQGRHHIGLQVLLNLFLGGKRPRSTAANRSPAQLPTCSRSAVSRTSALCRLRSVFRASPRTTSARCARTAGGADGSAAAPGRPGRRAGVPRLRGEQVGQLGPTPAPWTRRAPGRRGRAGQDGPGYRRRSHQPVAAKRPRPAGSDDRPARGSACPCVLLERPLQGSGEDRAAVRVAFGEHHPMPRFPAATSAAAPSPSWSPPGRRVRRPAR